ANAFGKFLDPTREQWTRDFRDIDRPKVSEEFSINRAFVANSGAVLFTGSLEKVPDFASSEIPILFAINRRLNTVHPLDQVDMFVIEQSHGELTFSEIRDRLLQSTSVKKAGHRIREHSDISFRKLLELGILIDAPKKLFPQADNVSVDS